MKLLLTILLSVLTVAGCAKAPPTATSSQQGVQSRDQLLVYAVNAPLAWLAREIGGAAVEVKMPIPASIDPAYWQPDAQAILPWQGADLILLNGAGYASWLTYASLPPDILVDTSASLSDQYIARDSGASHSHGPQGEHSHGEQAFTLWLDLRLARGQADAIYQELAVRLPEKQSQLQQRYLIVAAQLDRLDTRVLEQASTLTGRSIVYSHPVYQYFARRYGIAGISVHWEPDVEPSPEQWQHLEQELGQAQRPLMIWEAQPLAVVRQRLRQLGVEVLVFEPGADASEPDFAALMAANVERMQAVFR
jgi:zinc transport system substrate-binding protein